MELAMSAKEPYNYFLLLRALFRSIGGGSHDLLYQEFLPLLPSLLQGDTHTHTSFCVWTSYFCLFLLFISTFHLVLLLLNVFAYLWITCLCQLPILSACMNNSKITEQISVKFGIGSSGNMLALQFPLESTKNTRHILWQPAGLCACIFNVSC